MAAGICFALSRCDFAISVCFIYVFGDIISPNLKQLIILSDTQSLKIKYGVRNQHYIGQ
jgi:hypothetical protein